MLINYFFLLALPFVSILFPEVAIGQKTAAAITWPTGKKVAISLTFDDARESQVNGGTALLDSFGVKATFFVVPSGVEKSLAGWKKAVLMDHEIGNHSLNHPCTGNFAWSRNKALEDYSLDKMRKELIDCNSRIQELLNVKAEVFAYPCGQKFVGRGRDTKSYVPLIAELFILGRGWLDEGATDPAFCDFAQVTGVESDGKEFETVLPLIEQAKKTGQWLVLAGHEMAASGPQTTRLSMLRNLLTYAQNPANGIWIAPAGTVAKYIQQQRK